MAESSLEPSTPQQPPAKPRFSDALAALRIPHFRRFFWAALASNSGTWLQALAGPFVIKEITNSASWVGLAAFAQVVPMALIGPIAGPLADRIPRRRILIATQFLLSMVAFGQALLWWGGARTPLPYIALAVAQGIIGGFNMPAWQAFVSDLVPRESLVNAITLNSTQFNAARLFGPAVGGIVLSEFGPGFSFAGNGVSYSIVIAALISLPDKAPIGGGATKERLLKQFAAAWRYVRQHPALRAPYIAVFFFAFFGGPVSTVHLIFFAEDVFGVGGGRFGLLVAAYGGGAILAAPLVATFGPTARRSLLLTGALAVFGIGELVLASTTTYWVGVVGVMVAGMAHLTVATSANSTLQLLVAEKYRGRVMSMYLMILTLGLPFGALTQGALVDAFSPRPIMVWMGISLIGVAAWLWFTGRAQLCDATSLDGDLKS